MIVEAFVRLLVALARGVADLFDSIPLPSFWGNVDGWFASLAATGSGMSQWIPWTVILSGVAFVFACAVASFTIRLVRVFVSLFTGGGGSAA